MMSMQVYSTVEFALVFLCYSVLILSVPSLMFSDHLKGKTVTYWFMFCMTVGNVYVITWVMVLGLFGIVSRFTTLFCIFGGAIWRHLVKSNYDYIGKIKHELHSTELMLKGEMGVKYFFYRKYVWIKSHTKAILQKMRNHFVEHPWEWIFIIAISIFNIWFYSYQTLHYYGYGASDSIVHMQWVENIAMNKVFASGVYPHGFHCIVYFMYEVFRFDIFVLMRYFGALQAVYITLMIFVFTKYLCKSKYAPFIAFLAFSMCQVFHTETFMRFQMTVPQEYGMIFIYPMMIYLSKFVRERKEEIEEMKRQGTYKKVKDKNRPPFLKRALAKIKMWALQIKSLVWRVPGVTFFKNQSSLWLALAAINFSLTISVHFYIAISSGFLCVAFAIIYFPYILRKPYFWRMAIAVFCALILSIAPLAIAVATGQRLEGSLRWAMSIITGGGSSDSSEDDGESVDSSASPSATPDEGEGEEEVKDTSPMGILKDCYSRTVPIVLSKGWFLLTMGCIALALGLSFIRVWFVKKKSYDLDWMVVGVYILLMFVLFNSSSLGIPELMDKIRARVLLAYAIVVIFSYPIDLGLSSLMFILRKVKKKIRVMLVDGVSLILCTAIFCGVVVTDSFKRPSYFYYLQHNGAIICLYDIVNRYPDQMWTIVSPVDETRMVWNHGYHYELIDFILDMENWNASKVLTLPTQYVFIYVEKKVLKYSSVQKANKPLPDNLIEVCDEYASKKMSSHSSKSEFYHDADRPILMSRIYYWAQAYEKLFPNELEVYYEDDYFICYKIEQNVYHLNNFAIDYGYNVKKKTENK